MKIKEKDLLKALAQYGYPLFEPDAQVDLNQLLAELAVKKDPRLLEGFPVVLAHALGQPGVRFDVNKAGKGLSPSDNRLLRALYRLSCELFDLYGLEFPGLKKKDMTRDEKLQNDLAKDHALQLEHTRLDSKRLKETFLKYVVHQKSWGASESDLQLKDDLRQEFLLSYVLTPRQKQLLNKKLEGGSFTKTEREYFSRVVKKKLQALANPDLHNLAQKALSL